MGYSSAVNWKAVKEIQERFNYIEEPFGQTTNASAATEKTTEDDFLSQKGSLSPSADEM
jgi:hypothetical protein